MNPADTRYGKNEKYSATSDPSAMRRAIPVSIVAYLPSGFCDQKKSAAHSGRRKNAACDRSVQRTPG
jgi:hypothetical protein